MGDSTRFTLEYHLVRLIGLRDQLIREHNQDGQCIFPECERALNREISELAYQLQQFGALPKEFWEGEPSIE